MLGAHLNQIIATCFCTHSLGCAAFTPLVWGRDTNKKKNDSSALTKKQQNNECAKLTAACSCGSGWFNARGGAEAHCFCRSSSQLAGYEGKAQNKENDEWKLMLIQTKLLWRADKMEALTRLSHAVSTFDFLKGEDRRSSHSGHHIFIFCKARPCDVAQFYKCHHYNHTKLQTSKLVNANLWQWQSHFAHLPCCLLQELGCSVAHPGIHSRPRLDECPVLRLWLVAQVGSSTSPSSERPHWWSAHLCLFKTQAGLSTGWTFKNTASIPSIPSRLSTMCSTASASPMNFTSNTSMATKTR